MGLKSNKYKGKLLLSLILVIPLFFPMSVSANWITTSDARQTQTAFENGGLLYTPIPSTADEVSVKQGVAVNTLTVLTIPATISDGTTTYKVTKVEDSAFMACINLTDVIIQSGITQIGKNAFQGCLAIKSIDIPDTVTTLEDSAFFNCRALQSITLPKNMTTVSQHLFNNCRKLTNVTLPSGITSIGESAFEGCTSLSELEIPENVNFLGQLVFSECSSLNKITMPSTITSIGNTAFEEIPTNAKIIVTSPKVVTSTDRTNSVIVNAVTSCQDNLGAFYKYDPTGANGNVYFGDITTMKAIGAVALVENANNDVTLTIDCQGNFPFVATDVNWSITNNVDTTTTVTKDATGNGKVHLGTNEIGTITVIATSIFDSSKTVTYTIQVVNNKLVTFNSDGGNYTPAVQTISLNGLVTEPTTPTKNGYTFDGWYLQGTNTKWDFTKDTVTKDTILEAKWIEKVASITFDSQGGNYTPPMQTISLNGLVTEPTIPTKNNYTFDGWYLQGTNTKWDFTKDTVTKDTILEAKWIEKVASITFDSQGGNYIPTVQTVTLNNLVTEPTTPTKNGYTFDGWYIQGTNTKWDFTKDIVTKDTVLEAKWVANVVNVNVTFDDGINQITISNKKGDMVKEPVNPTKDGYTFDGWYIQGTNTKWDFTKDVVNKDLILEAKWSIVAIANKEDVTNSKPPQVIQEDKKVIDTSDYTMIAMYVVVLGLVTCIIAIISLLNKKRNNS